MALTREAIYNGIEQTKQFDEFVLRGGNTPEEHELVDLLLMELSNLHSLDSLELKNIYMDVSQYKVFMNYLKSNELSSLHLIDIVKSIEEMQQLVEALANSSFLLDLEVSSGSLGDSGAILLAELMTALPSLSSVTYHLQRMTNSGAKAILKAVESNSHISNYQVDLSVNKMTRLGVEITEIANLARLHLAYNKIRQEDVVILCNALINNTTLKVLHVGFKDRVSIELSEAMANLLRKNSSLERLDISNRNGKFSSNVVIDALKYNTSLVGFNFEGPDFNDNSLELLIATLECNRTLENIYCYNVGVTEHGATKLWHHLLKRPIKFFLHSLRVRQELIRVINRAHRLLLMDLCCASISRSRELLDNSKGVIPEELYLICEAFHKHYDNKSEKI
eukprot:TRINITY_DN699_c0_g1_i3.p1 TRINITY_DN699_c0_g1~~TRINITY_DN699_c0_g1_i3.p1  ORF type:complete len:393 (-),score=67.99 TRINITY_DN699_c0_g1_i3:451-1629(-)